MRLREQSPVGKEARLRLGPPQGAQGRALSGAGKAKGDQELGQCMAQGGVAILALAGMRIETGMFVGAKPRGR